MFHSKFPRGIIITKQSCVRSKVKIETLCTKGVVNLKSNGDKQYIHIAPCGDWWTGSEVFAAKHLQPDYVKSIPLPPSLNKDLETLLEDYQGELDILMKKVYDTSDVNLLLKLKDKT